MIRFRRLSIRIRPGTALAAVLTGIAILLLAYSQTVAFTWDAGFHLLAAQMINGGKRPYIDFCFPQTPLNAWWMAFWMRLLGQGWRVAQAMAALATVGAVALASVHVFQRMPLAEWRVGAAAATAILLGLNDLVFRFGTVAQAYGVCLFLTVAAFTVAVGTPDRPRPWRPAAAGFLAGAALGCSLLSAAAAPVLLAWIAFYSRKGNRWAKSAAFVAGAAIPFLPIARLFLAAPAQAWFNIVQYQLAYRHANWGNTAGHDLAQVSAWLDSAPALALLLLAIAAGWFVRRPECGPVFRSELYLSACLALALGVELALAHPTFARYFVLAVPFLAILAGPGLCEIVTRLRGSQAGSFLPVSLLAVFMLMGAARTIYDNSDVYLWRDLEKVAARIRQIAPPNAMIYAEEPVYFLMRMDPPEGMQFAYSRDLDLPPAQAARMHIVPQKEMDRRVKAGVFDVVEVCVDQDTIDRLKLKSLYRKTEELANCDIFSGKP